MSRKDDFCVECGRDLECELCSIEDGLVREWVMKARGVARSKGLLSVAGLPAAGRVADVPTPDVEPRAGEPNQPAMTSLPSDPTQEKEYEQIARLLYTAILGSGNAGAYIRQLADDAIRRFEIQQAKEGKE